MVSHVIEHELSRRTATAASDASRLRNYYWIRAGVSAAWVAGAFAIGPAASSASAALLVAYPAWDALANWEDATRNGGLARNRTQALNVAVSGAAALGVVAALGDMRVVLQIFGVWASLAGLLQLATGVRRWKAYGAQWAMVLSGAQSALAGGFFIARAHGPAVPSILDIAPYAAFGAFYFLVSALWLTLRRNPAR
jgi:hypothetical protein